MGKLGSESEQGDNGSDLPVFLRDHFIRMRNGLQMVDDSARDEDIDNPSLHVRLTRGMRVMGRAEVALYFSEIVPEIRDIILKRFMESSRNDSVGEDRDESYTQGVFDAVDRIQEFAITNSESAVTEAERLKAGIKFYKSLEESQR